MDIAEAAVCLVLGADVVIQSLIPADHVVLLGHVDDIVVICVSIVRVWSRIQIEDVLCYRIELAGAVNILLTIAGKQGRSAGSRLIQRDRLALSGERGVEQF